MRDNWLSAELTAKDPGCFGMIRKAPKSTGMLPDAHCCSRMLLLYPLCSEIWKGGRRRRGKAKFNGRLMRKPLFAMAGGVRCVLSVYLAGQFGGGSSAGRAGNVGQFGGGKSGGVAGRRGCYTMQGTPVYGEGGIGKTAGPFWVWGRIHHPHPLPHSTAFDRPLPDLIPPRQIAPCLSSLSAYGVQRAAEGVPEKRAVGSLETARRNNNRKFTGLWRDLPWPGFCAHGAGNKFM